MASTTMQDPRSTQARSAWLAGLTEVCAKITGILNMGTASFEDLPMIEERPSDNEEDIRKIYIVPLGYKLWLNTPRPVIKLNGNVLPEDGYDYSIDYLGGSIVFEGDFRPQSTDVITASATYVTGDSKTMAEVMDKLEELDNKAAKNYKGYYETLADMEAAGITGVPGDYVIIEDTNDIYVWNEKTGKYESTYKVPDLSDYYTIEETDNLLDGKENSIAPYGDTTASDAFYYGGRKTWVDLYSMVLGTALNGIVFTDDSTILETDTVVKALGKLQSQITAKVHDIVSTGAPTEATEGIVGQDYINSANGDKYHLTTITDDGKYIWEKYADVSGVLKVPGGGNAVLEGEFGEPPYEFKFEEDTSTHVNSFNGRTGAVTPQKNDYSADKVSFSSGNTGMTSTDVDSAIKELFTSVSEGKSLIASAITDMGGATTADASFSSMANAIRSTNIHQVDKITSNRQDQLNSSTGIITLDGIYPADSCIFILDFLIGSSGYFGFGSINTYDHYYKSNYKADNTSLYNIQVLDIGGYIIKFKIEGLPYGSTFRFTNIDLYYFNYIGY